MKTMCPPGYHHNGFVATHALGHMMYGSTLLVLRSLLCLLSTLWFIGTNIQAILETGIPVWATNLWLPKSTFQVFFFQLYFNKKYVEVAISDFTMHLIISKWLRIQKCRQMRKTRRQRGQSKRRKPQWLCGNSCTWAHNVRFHIAGITLLALLVEHSLVHWYQQCGTVHHVPKCMSCHKAIVVITGRAHCFHDYIYITLILLL